MSDQIETPEPVLLPGIIYLGDNGQSICLKCAGSSAKYTGRDLSGQKVFAVPFSEAAVYHQMRKEIEGGHILPAKYSCECGHVTYPEPSDN